MIKVGLTGNIGSGKSTVSNIFSTFQIPVFTADLEAKKILEKEDIINKLQTFFQTTLRNKEGSIDRQKIASIIFNNQEALNFINNLIHPLVAESFKEWLKLQSNKPYIIHEAAILYESGFDKYMDQIIYVNAPEEIRIQRIISRDHISRSEVLSRMSNQWADDRKKGLADYVIENDNYNLIIPQVMFIHQNLLQLSSVI